MKIIRIHITETGKRILSQKYAGLKFEIQTIGCKYMYTKSPSACGTHYTVKKSNSKRRLKLE
jgi:hypothetical protein